MTVKEIFTCVFKYTQAVEVTAHKKNPVDTPLISPSRLTCSAKIKEKILTHICYRVNVNSELGTWSQVCLHFTFWVFFNPFIFLPINYIVIIKTRNCC